MSGGHHRNWSASRIEFELAQEHIEISRRTVTRVLARLGFLDAERKILHIGIARIRNTLLENGAIFLRFGLFVYTTLLPPTHGNTRRHGGISGIGGLGGALPAPHEQTPHEQTPHGDCFTKIESVFLNKTQRQPVVPGRPCRPISISAARKFDDLIVLGD